MIDEIVAEQQEIDYKAFYEANQEKVKSFDAVVAKKDELLAETKRAKAEKDMAKAEAMKAAQDKAQKDGEFEKLFHQKSEREKELLKELDGIKHSNRQERIQNQALRIANELADGDNVELLSDFVSRNIDKLADEIGALSADTIAAVTKEFQTNGKYKSLLRGNGSVGGSAPGNSRSAALSNTITRADFEQMGQYERGQFFAKGGKLTD